jgi:hypothetical protein
MSLWYQFKLLVEHASGISMDALHILAGVGLQVLFAAFFRISLGNWRPWLFVFLLLLANEASDLWVEQWPQPAMQYGEGLKDVFLTMALPTMLALLVKTSPAILHSGSGPIGVAADENRDKAG